MWPLLILAAVGYYYWTKSSSSYAGASPNVVVKGGVQYARRPSEEEDKAIEAAMSSYSASDPQLLNEGPLAGSAVILLAKQAAPSDANSEAAIAAIMKTGPLLKVKDASDVRVLLAVEQIDAVVQKNYPAQIRLYVAPAAVALQAAKAPSAYAILDGM